LKFEFEPYKGPIPLEFGMTQSEVSQVLGAPPKYSRPPNEYGRARDDYGYIGVNFDEHGKAAEFCFSPSNEFSLVYLGTTIIGQGAVNDPISIFKRIDPKPKETLGFLVFLGLGVNTTGYHDNDNSQRAINVFKRGFWDGHIV
jgi:hypothetical protein